MSNKYPIDVPSVSHIHGLYWTADYVMADWANKANRSVINSLRSATVVTAPSNWVAQTVRRDMRIDPVVVGHGIDWQEWEHNEEHEGYVLWNKNRNVDVCSPRAVHELAEARKDIKFLSTFADGNLSPNMKITGLVPHETMRGYVQRAQVYLATTKETFGIGTLEAMASGVPVLGFNHGGTAQIIEHGVTGYLSEPGDFDDLVKGLDYCIKFRQELGDNAKQAVKKYDWGEVAQFLADSVYKRAVKDFDEGPGVSVIIPCYNKIDTLQRAVQSALKQTLLPVEIIIVDNNSTDGSSGLAQELSKLDGIRAFNCAEQGVAHARNAGIAIAETKYVCCLDADDEIDKDFLRVCVEALNNDSRLGLAYTKLLAIAPDGTRTVSQWPGHYNFDGFSKSQNQVPTCNVFRRKLWERTGGFRQRYAPHGAGAEDAEFWMRMGAIGFKGELVSEKPLFIYHLGGAVSGNSHYSEVNWRAWHPWCMDGDHPFASVATPANRFSHRVRQYDKPVVSVIVPCTEKHFKYLVDVLDSVEAQTYRLWEIIVVYDSRMSAPYIEKAYPHVKFLHTQGDQGPGVARNIGAAAAVAPMLLFIDADDWLMPDALDYFVRSYQNNPDSIVYSDYLAHSFIEDKTAIQKIEMKGRLRNYDPVTTEAIIYHRSSEYDCARAHAQPDVGRMYIWNLITCLVPKRFHDEIGGFDETMESWEDWDYWLRMSHRGWCFTQISNPLVEYRFYTGTRRARANPDESGESGRQLGQELIQYLRNKYEGVKKIMCSGCRKNRALPPVAPAVSSSQSLNAGVVNDMHAGDMVWVVLADGNIGSHPISFGGTSYGYRMDGEKFKMQAAHAQLDRRVRIAEAEIVQPTIAADPLPDAQPPPSYAEWIEEDEGEVTLEMPELESVLDEPVTDPQSLPQPESVETLETAGALVIDSDGILAKVQNANSFSAPEEPEEVEIYDLTKIWGITAENGRDDQLRRMGARTPEAIVGMGYENIVKLLDVTDLVAKRMITSAKEQQ